MARTPSNEFEDLAAAERALFYDLHANGTQLGEVADQPLLQPALYAARTDLRARYRHLLTLKSQWLERHFGDHLSPP